MRRNYLNDEAMRILDSLSVVEVSGYNLEEWRIDLPILRDKTPEINWNVGKR